MENKERRSIRIYKKEQQKKYEAKRLLYAALETVLTILLAINGFLAMCEDFIITDAYFYATIIICLLTGFLYLKEQEASMEETRRQYLGSWEDET